MIIFPDISGTRFISRLDPRVRVATVLPFAILICLSERTPVLVGGLTTSLALLCLSGVPPERALRRLATLNAFLALLVVTMPLSIPGQPVLQLGPAAWSMEGLARATQVTARANAVMMMLTALLGTMEATHLGYALTRLGVPEKFAHLLLFMVRYIDVIHHEYHRLRDAMLLRAFRPRFNRHTLRTFGFLIGQLLVRSINRSERILEAMKCRGFHGRFYVLTPCRFSRGDIAFAATALVTVSALAIVEWI